MRELIKKLEEITDVASGLVEGKKYPAKEAAGAMAAFTILTYYNPQSSDGKKNFDVDMKGYSDEEKKAVREELSKIRKELLRRR